MKRMALLLAVFAFLGCCAANGDDAAKPNLIGVTDPPYGSSINGDTPLAIHAPGWPSVTVRCWHLGDGFGSDSIVGTVPLDEQGNGSLVFPANDYPHGPITVRIIGEHADAHDTCYFQLYNRGGVSWNEGVPVTPPPAAEGMSLVYADDFDGALSISNTPAPKTYLPHMPPGGDFSQIPFTDYDSPNNPFAHVDSYLRIHADVKKNSTGLISSLQGNGTGIVAKAPCYFECRFLAQSAPGTWPAFWLLTSNISKGLKTPGDELDVIEAYGGDGPKDPKQTGYWVTPHVWNQPGLKAPAEGKQIPMMTLGGHASWADTFHVYGVKVTETDTIYYCDNVEVTRYHSTPLSKTLPLYFIINLAIGGNGWPVDLSRYGGVADMYVDYVRVYQK